MDATSSLSRASAALQSVEKRHNSPKLALHDKRPRKNHTRNVAYDFPYPPARQRPASRVLPPGAAFVCTPGSYMFHFPPDATSLTPYPPPGNIPRRNSYPTRTNYQNRFSDNIYIRVQTKKPFFSFTGFYNFSSSSDVLKSIFSHNSHNRLFVTASIRQHPG